MTAPIPVPVWRRAAVAARDYLAMHRDPRSIPELDGLRALAILLVLARHASRPFWDRPGPLLPIGGWDAATPMINGWLGVDLFFVLSGFLIARYFIKRWDADCRRIDLGVYVAKRALRIVPAYYAVLAIALAGWFPLHRISTEFVWFSASYHILFLQDYLPANIVVTFWSLGVEEKFYLLAPLLLLSILRLKHRGLQYAAVVLLAISAPVARYLTHVGHPEVETYEEFFHVFRSPFHLCLDALLFGTLCALIYRDRNRYRWTQRPRSLHGLFWLGVACIAWLVAAVPMLDDIGLFDKTLQQTLLAAGMAAMLLSLALGGGPGEWFRGHLMFVVARISYSWYLVHFPLLPGTVAMLEMIPGFAGLTTALQFALFLPVYLTVTAIAALLLHYAVEKPFLVLKDRIGAGRQATESGQARAAA